MVMVIVQVFRALVQNVGHCLNNSLKPFQVVFSFGWYNYSTIIVIAMVIALR